jgi:hypothetical protein
MPKRRVLAFGITPNTQHTNCNTEHCRHHIAQCYSLGVRWRHLGSRLLLGETRMIQDGPTTPPKRRSAAGTALGTQRVVTSMARGLLRSHALTRRSSPNQTCSIKRREKINMGLSAKYIYSSYLFALSMRVSRGLRTCQVACGQKRMS